MTLKKAVGCDSTCSFTGPQGVEVGRTKHILTWRIHLDWHMGYMWDHQDLDDEDCIGVNNIHVTIVSFEKAFKSRKIAKE